MTEIEKVAAEAIRQETYRLRRVSGSNCVCPLSYAEYFAKAVTAAIAKIGDVGSDAPSCGSKDARQALFHVEQAAKWLRQVRNTQQSSDMVGRVAGAIWETRSPVIPFGDLNDAETKNDLCSVAAAALEASHHAELVEALVVLLAEARERGGAVTNGEVLGCGALRSATGRDIVRDQFHADAKIGSDA